jgi:hypothetical protein
MTTRLSTTVVSPLLERILVCITYQCNLKKVVFLETMLTLIAAYETSIVYMEDDTRLSWASLASRALDTEVLEQLNFTRCIYRTELSPDTGEVVMFDWGCMASHSTRP